VLALTSDGEGPAALARLLADIGFGASRMTVLEALGGPRERQRVTTAGGFDLGDVGALNAVAIEVEAAPGARVLARVAALPTSCSSMTARSPSARSAPSPCPRSVPRRGELLWDVGAGAGSVAIEWMLADPSMRAVAIEARGRARGAYPPQRRAFGVPALEIVEGRAPRPSTDSRSRMQSSSAAAPAMRSARRRDGRASAGGRLVVNAVTLEAEALLLAAARKAWRRAHPGRDCARGADRAAWRLASAMPLTQWAGSSHDRRGVGCRKGASADDIGAVIGDALARAGFRRRRST
jgi:precorrin-6Y C5,15-methyltransferase (decarboxylating)